MHRSPSVNGNLFQLLFEAHRQLPLQKAAFAVAGLLLQWLLTLRQLTLVCGSVVAWYFYKKEHSAKPGRRLRHVARALPRQPALLPPRVLHSPEQLTVVLDLDETLVMSYRASLVPHHLCPHQDSSALHLHCSLGNASTTGVVAFLRPGLHEFLLKASQFAELIVFTAALPDYAQPLLDEIDPQNEIFSARLYRDATVTAAGRQHCKDLAQLGRDMSRCVLLDNNPFSFLQQPCNGIPVKPFAGDADDRQLLTVLLPMLESLSRVPDVRPCLAAKYGMASWFAERGYAVSHLC